MLEFAGNFEAHLTVQAETDAECEAFKIWCQQRQMKCVRIVLSRGESPEQPMATWRRSSTRLSEVVREGQNLVDDATADGFHVVRLKFETPLGNEDVPQTDADVSQNHAALYFEHHIKLQLEKDPRLANLARIAERHGAHLSRNAFSAPRDDCEFRFVTIRSYHVGADSSLRELDALMSDLRQAEHSVVEVESEYSVYDTNLALDNGWLPERTSSHPPTLQK